MVEFFPEILFDFYEKLVIERNYKKNWCLVPIIIGKSIDILLFKQIMIPLIKNVTGSSSPLINPVFDFI